MLTPPKAKQRVYQTDDGRSDSYFWLREKENPEVLEHLKAENAYCKSVLESTDAMQEKLFQEMKDRIKETDTSAPWQMGGYDYYFRTEAGYEYRIFCRKKHPDGIEEILLDENLLAKHHSYFRVGNYALSPDQNLLAYALDTAGDEYYTIHIKDLTTQQLLSDTLEGVGDSVVFSAENQHFWYVQLDAAHRPYQIWQHNINTPMTDDRLVFHETDERFFISPSRTKDDRFLLVECHSKASTEIHYTDARTLTLPVTCLYSRAPDIEYDIDHHHDHFFIRTNEAARNFQLVKVPSKNPDKKNWQVLLAHQENIPLDEFEIMQDFVVALERRNGLPTLRVLNLSDNSDYLIDFPESAYSAELGDNWIITSNILRFEYQSFTEPASVFDFNLQDKSRVLIKQTSVLGDYHAQDYQAERVWAQAKDGTKIPISLVYKKDCAKPALLYLMGYGAYGAEYDAWFSTARLSLLNRGFVFAVAHIRGGGEFGKPWHDAGKLFNKQNTFSDFIACAEHLINNHYTSPAQLVINGGSAGGLLMGAVINQRPDLFAVCVAHVPFVDVLSTMLDPSLPLSITEYEEWGNPNQAQDYAYMTSYSPYDNIKAQAYPALLVTAGLTDWLVPYWEAAKWVAKLREYKTDDHLLLLKMDLEAGHFGLSGRYTALREVALEYAFILKVLC